MWSPKITVPSKESYIFLRCLDLKLFKCLKFLFCCFSRTFLAPATYWKICTPEYGCLFHRWEWKQWNGPLRARGGLGGRDAPPPIGVGVDSHIYIWIYKFLLGEFKQICFIFTALRSFKLFFLAGGGGEGISDSSPKFLATEKLGWETNLTRFVNLIFNIVRRQMS